MNMAQRFSPNATLNLTTRPLKRRRQPRGDPTPDLFPSPHASSPSLERPTKKRRALHEERSLEVQDQTEADADALRPPQFWDNLTPRIPLVKAALKELDRRNRQTITSPTIASTPRIDGGIQQYARQGGPDLSDLRGVGEMPRDARQARGTRGRVQKPKGRGRRRTGSSQAPSNHTKTSSPYDAAFKQHLINHKSLADWPLPRNRSTTTSSRQSPRDHRICQWRPLIFRAGGLHREQLHHLPKVAQSCCIGGISV